MLEDLNRLEMASFDADDFDIDGSQTSGFGHLKHVRPPLEQPMPNRQAMHNCSSNLVIALDALCLLFIIFINAKDYHWADMRLYLL